MRVFIAVDMEGISGVVIPEQVKATEGAYRAACEAMLADANACVAGCCQGGAKSVTVWDAHASGFNMAWERIDARATLQQGANDYGRFHDIGRFDALILLGYHAMAGTPHAVLEHTMSSAVWQNLWINGRKAGEFAIDAGIAGDAGVPTIMVSGDDALCREARQWVPGIRTAQVKAGLATKGARLLAPATARALITSTAEQACRAAATIKPLVLRKPVRMRLELVERHPLPPACAGRPWQRVIDGRTFEVTGRDTREALYRLL